MDGMTFYKVLDGYQSFKAAAELNLRYSPCNYVNVLVVKLPEKRILGLF
jgi:hypothetical protein